MTSGQKIAFSFLVAMGLFAAFVLGLRTTVFKELETRFYTQAKIEEYTEQLNKISESYDLYITEILTQLETGENAWIKTSAVRSYYLQNPSESDVNERRSLTEEIFQKISTLDGIRIVDKNGRNVHYSSYDDTDVLKQSGVTKFYKNYPDIQKDADEMSFELLEKKSDKEKTTFIYDEVKDRIILSVPYYWMDGVYSGQCLFYFKWSEIEKNLIARNVLPVGQRLSMLTDDNYDGGFVIGLPAGSKAYFKNPVLKYWNNNASNTPERLLEMEAGRFYVALSNNNSSNVKISEIYTSDIFELSKEIVILIYISIFVSLLLIVFLFLSFARDPEVVLKKRIKKIQYGIIKEYLEKEDKIDWSRVSKQINSRKKDLSSEILKSLRVHSRKKRKELNEFLEQNWNDIFSAFDVKASAAKEQTVSAGNVSVTGELTNASLEEIRKIIEDVLQNTSINVAAVEKIAAPISPVIDDVEELAEDVEELDDVEELPEDAEEIAEDVEELPEDVEDLAEDVEELPEDVEEIAEDVEELPEDVEDLAEDVEELPEDVEELDDVEELPEDVEELPEDVEDLAEDVEELPEDVEDLAEDVEELPEDVEDLAENVEELPEDVEEIAEDVEELPEDVEDLAEDVEELPEDAEEIAEDVEELPEDAEELAEDVEELPEDVEELAEEVPVSPMNNLDISLLLKNVPVLEYRDSKDSYFVSEKFASVENVFAEELCLGPEIKLKKTEKHESSIKIFDLPKYENETYTEEPSDIENDEIQEAQEEIEELLEEVAEVLPYYSMTGFAENLSTETPILETAEMQDGAIIETEGVYSIAKDLEIKDIKQNLDFKALVDSVL